MPDVVTKCSVCQALLDEEDLFCPNCGTEAPQSAAASKQTSRESTHNFRCQGCGASMSYDAKAGTLRCPFCGSEDLDAQPDSKVLAPELVVPFTVKQDDAITAMRTWLGRSFWRPGDLSEQAAIVKMTAVYVPYWVFEAETHTFWTADTSQTPGGSQASWYPIAGEHRGRHEGLLVGASGALTIGETAQLCPFNLSDGISPDDVDLDNVIVESFSVPRKYARPQARQILDNLEREICAQNYVPGSSRNVHVNVRVTGLAGRPVLLPVWIMAYSYRDETFRFLLNGQTGAATGNAPTSWLKVAAVSALGVLGALILLGMLLGMLH